MDPVWFMGSLFPTLRSHGTWWGQVSTKCQVEVWSGLSRESQRSRPCWTLIGSKEVWWCILTCTCQMFQKVVFHRSSFLSNKVRQIIQGIFSGNTKSKFTIKSLLSQNMVLPHFKFGFLAWKSIKWEKKVLPLRLQIFSKQTKFEKLYSEESDILMLKQVTVFSLLMLCNWQLGRPGLEVLFIIGLVKNFSSA